MAIDLSEIVVTAKVVHTGDDTFQLTAGKILNIESSPEGEEYYKGTVPDGKVWNVTVFLKIEEVDV